MSREVIKKMFVLTGLFWLLCGDWMGWVVGRVFIRTEAGPVWEASIIFIVKDDSGLDQGSK